VTEFYRQYLAVAVFVVAAFGMVGAMLTVARILRPTLPQDEKYITYESGSDPLPLFGQANVRYYIYALLFVIFDVEAVFIFPWAIQVDQLRWFGLIEMTVFVLVLLLVLAYVWRKGLLKWALSAPTGRPSRSRGSSTTAASTRCGCSSGAWRAARSRWAPRSRARATT